MINVNIWLSTTKILGKRIKHKFFGPLLASEDKGENVGHVNFTIEVDERRSKDSFQFVEEHTAELKPKQTLSQVATVVTLTTAPSDIQMSHLKPELVRSDVVSHSFWPKRKPSKKEVITGVASDINTHEDDMLREDEEKPLEITHRKKGAEEVAREKSENFNLLFEISNLEVAMEQKDNFRHALDQLAKEKEQLLLKKEELIHQHQVHLQDLNKNSERNSLAVSKIQSQITAAERTLTYLKKLQNPDEKTRKQLTELTDKLEKLNQEKTALKKSQTEITEEIATSTKSHDDALEQIAKDVHKNEQGAGYLVAELSKLEGLIKGRTPKDVEDLKVEARRRKEYTTRKEQYIQTRDMTEGRQPDSAMILPTAESGLDYYIDEIEVLKAMQEERAKNYSFLFYNCASSAKRCILSGISEELKDALKTTGLTDKFFEVEKVETCMSLRNWTRTLGTKLNDLNFPPLRPSI